MLNKKTCGHNYCKAKYFTSFESGTSRINNLYILSQRGPVYPGIHVQLGYPVDPLTAHDPLFRHGGDDYKCQLKKNKL